MNGYAWAMVVLQAVGMLITVGTVGQQRPVTTPRTAVIGVIVTAMGMFLVYKAATV